MLGFFFLFYLFWVFFFCMPQKCKMRKIWQLFFICVNHFVRLKKSNSIQLHSLWHQTSKCTLLDIFSQFNVVLRVIHFLSLLGASSNKTNPEIQRLDIRMENHMLPKNFSLKTKAAGNYTYSVINTERPGYPNITSFVSVHFLNSEEKYSGCNRCAYIETCQQSNEKTFCVSIFLIAYRSGLYTAKCSLCCCLHCYDHAEKKNHKKALQPTIY